MHHFCQSSDLIMPSTTSGPRTLYDKVFQDHVVDEREDGTILLYIGEYSKDVHRAITIVGDSRGR